MGLYLKVSIVIMAVVLSASCLVYTANGITVADLRVEYAQNPLGIDSLQPRLSWKLYSEKRAQLQTAYRVLVASDQDLLGADVGDVWDSGKVESDQSTHVIFRGKDLESGKRYFWKVRVWDKDGEASPWSAPAWWEMGLLKPTDWTAEWIKSGRERSFGGAYWIWAPEDDDPLSGAPAGVRYFRFTFELPGKGQVVKATLLSAADDAHTIYLNGKESGSSTGWQPALLTDVTGLISSGRNVLAVKAENRSGPAGFICKLIIRMKDGKSLIICSNKKWKSSARLYSNWQEAGYKDGRWASARAVAFYGDEPWGREAIFQGGSDSCPYMRKTFEVSKPVAAARLYMTARGLYEPYINGRRVGKNEFSPGWTDYDTRLQYQTYDVTDYIIQGKNALGAIVGDGWYAGSVGWFGPGQYGVETSLLGKLQIIYADGSVQTVVTDESWKVSDGPVEYSDILLGETYDARKELGDWCSPQYDDSKWMRAVVTDGYKGQLTAQFSPPDQVTREIKPIKMTEPLPGVYVFDLGQNMVGNVRLKVRGQAGTKVRLTYGEVLKPDGTIYTDNLRAARQIDEYVLGGKGDEVYEPRFTFHGFRYVMITGYPGKPTLSAVTGRVIHSAMPETGSFETDSALLNKLQSNIVWGQRGNFLSVPMDCPQRDERLGWTADAQIFAPTASYNMDVASFMCKYVLDLRDSQRPNGAFTDVAPHVGNVSVGAAGWGDAGVIIPWTIYLRYGDLRVIEESYESAVKWINYLKLRSKNFIRPAEGYGDWLNVKDETPKDFLATAYFAWAARIVSEMAGVLGRDHDRDLYARLFEDVKKAFNDTYVRPDGRIKSETQTSYVIALYMGLLPEEKRQTAFERLIYLIQKKDWHLSTGFLGTPHLLTVLTENGRPDVAYRLINNTTYPSWGYQIVNGATTIWERWDGLTPDGKYQDPGMNSFNHYGFGSVGDWMYRYVAGISPDPKLPGYKHIIIHPVPGGDLSRAEGRYESVYGTISCGWVKEDDELKLTVEIPVNTSATIYVPVGKSGLVSEGGKPADQAEGLKFLRMEDNAAVYSAGSGIYEFSSSMAE